MSQISTEKQFIIRLFYLLVKSSLACQAFKISFDFVNSGRLKTLQQNSGIKSPRGIWIYLVFKERNVKLLMAYTQLTRILSMFRCEGEGRNIYLYICIFLCFAQMLSLIFSHLQIANTN